MSSVLPAHAVSGIADEAQGFRPRSKTDQWICWWSIPIFYNLFGLIFVALTRVMPPPSPALSTVQIVAFFITA